jgi:hypothetical protein
MSVVMLNVIILSVTNADCHYDKHLHTKCHYAKCHYKQFYYVKCHYAKCRYFKNLPMSTLALKIKVNTLIGKPGAMF